MSPNKMENTFDPSRSDTDLNKSRTFKDEPHKPVAP